MDLGLEHVNNPKMPVGRRGFMAGSAALAGFAACMQPVSAETIITDANGLTAGPVTIMSGSFSVPGYRAFPAGKPGAPVILVVHEAFGVHEHIADLCRRLAKLGYYAVAPDLFARIGEARTVSDIGTLVRDYIGKTPDTQALGDLDAAVAFAKAEGGQTDKLAITGFCWGGRIVWLYAERNPGLKAAVAWYGPLEGQKDELRPANPVDRVADLKCPVLGLYGGADTGIKVESTQAIKKAADATGKTVEIVVYPDTPHAFNADYRPSYREGPAKDGWSRMLAWFKANGVSA